MASTDITVDLKMRLFFWILDNGEFFLYEAKNNDEAEHILHAVVAHDRGWS